MKKYRPGVFIVTYRKKEEKIEYLLLYRKLHWEGWEFPKGGIEKKENLKSTVKRELGEETGLCIKKIKSFDIEGKFEYKRDFKDRPGYKGQSWRLFAVEIENESKVKIDKREHSDYKWMKFEEALESLKWENQKECLKIVDEWLKRKKFNRNLREFETSTGKKVLSGKDEKSNEKLIKRYMGEDKIVMHTKKAGSPFSIILNKSEEITKKDLKETAILTAKYSRDWKRNKSNVNVHIFNAKDIYKSEDMKTGTFGIKDHDEMIIKKGKIKDFERKLKKNEK